MIYNFVRRTAQRLLTAPRFNYGELVYTNQLTSLHEFPKMPTYRAIDLDGNLLDKTISYDPAYLNKILKAMVFVDEMDAILLKVKAQGTVKAIQARSLSI
jgi:hypothetical protein